LTGPRKHNSRNALAVVLSALFHIAIIAMLVTQVTPEYRLPDYQPPPMDVRIEPMPPIVIPREKITPVPPITVPVVPPIPKPEKTKPEKTEKTETTEQAEPIPPAPIPNPAPPKPAPVKPAPPAPPKPVPAPAKPAPTPPKPAPVAAAKPAPAPAPVPAPVPATAPKVAPAPKTAATVAPPTQTVTAAPSPSPVAQPSKLNIHKSDKNAPASAPTLPMAPAAGMSAAQAAQAAALAAAVRAGGASGAPASAGSRLSGLSPYPYGSMPSGGSGLRGTLVGCANATAVNLSSVERAHCNERFGVEAASAPPLDSISPFKRAAFDAAAARQELNRRRGAAGVDPMTAMSHAAQGDMGGGTVGGPASSFTH
jgi:hypothetical protein